MKLILVLLTLCLVPLVLGAQNSFLLKGKVTDQSTGEPLAKVNIFINETVKGTTTNDSGYYEIKIDQLPALLIFSSVGYTRRFFNIDKKPETNLDIPLLPSLHEIPEVEIIAKRQALAITKDLDIYVTDYEFYDDHILLLGHPGKRSKDVLLSLIDRKGNTILTKKIRDGVNLYRDPFNNIHLLANDSAYQIYFDEKDIKLLYPIAKKQFMTVFPEFLKVYQDKVIMRQFAFEDQALMYYFYNPSDTSVTRIWAQATAEVFREVDGWMSRIRISPTGKSTTTFDLFNTDERFIKMAFYAPIFCPLEIVNDTIYVFNFNNSLIETIGPEGYPVKSPTLMTFYTDPGWQKKIYNDVARNKVYTQYMSKGITTLREIDIHKGMLTENEIRIPDFAFIKKIHIHDGHLYFLYQEKKYPKYQKLFRMEL